jgi:phosphoglycolate phosphatase
MNGPARRIRAVLFDLDGTLVDSAPGLAAAVNDTLTALNLPPVDLVQIRLWIGNGMPRLLKRALTHDQTAEPEAALYARAWPLFLAAYDRHLDAGSVLYPGAAAILARLAARGIALGCVTNKLARFTHPILRHLGIADYFRVVVGGDTLTARKPDPTPVLHALRQLDATPGEALLVGDSATDVQAGRAAGCLVICVGYGYNHGLDLHRLGAAAIIDTLSDVDLYLNG